MLDPSIESMRLEAAAIIEQLLDATASQNRDKMDKYHRLWDSFLSTHNSLSDQWIDDVKFIFVHWTGENDDDCRSMIKNLRDNDGRI